MNTERVFQICVSSMAVLATLMLGTSQENNLLPIVAFFAAIVALVFTDFLGWFSFHPIVAGALGLLAGLYAFMQMQTGGLEGQFVSVANLLIHLQIVLLFQKKAIRIYWQLITLSLLQVVVASALNLFVFFGPLLVLYTAVAILALITFFICRETNSSFSQAAPRTSKQSSFIQIESPSISNLISPRRRLMRTSGFRSFGLLSVSTILTSSAVFLFMPRFGDGVWRPGNAGMAATGFSGTVDLADIADVFENPTLVMRVGFKDEAKQQPYVLNTNPYLRGSVSDEYEYSRGRWNRVRETRREAFVAIPRPQRIFSAVRQTVSFEVTKGNTVFSLAPVCALEDTSASLRLDDRNNEVRFFAQGNEDPASYSLGTLSLHNGQQSEFSPIRRSLNSTIEGRRSLDVQRYLPDLATLAAEVLTDVSQGSVLQRARKLEAFFRDKSQGFVYSLDASPNRQRDVDPVVDFVTNHRSGHCQYFASALALMLRSQGIPSRVVVGYVGNNYNDIGNYYEIREMDAHAWVEAAIPAAEIPQDEVLPREGISGDAWVRLDPTPQAELALENVTVSPWRAKLGDTLDYMQLLWSEYVLGLNEKRQRRRIYEPIQAFFRSAATSIFSPHSWAARWEALLERFRGNLFTRENFRDSTIAVAVVLIGLYVLRSVWRFSRASVRSWRARRRALGPRIEFYVRLEKLLGKHGLRRHAQQTAHEFAVFVHEQLERWDAEPAMAAVPERTVDLFYQVRFGGRELDDEESRHLDIALGRLQEFLSRHKRSMLKK